MSDAYTSLITMPDEAYEPTVASLGLDDAMKDQLRAQRAAVRGQPASMPMASEPPPVAFNQFDTQGGAAAPMQGITYTPGQGVTNSNPMPPQAPPRPQGPRINPSTAVGPGAVRQPAAPMPQQQGGGQGGGGYGGGFGGISRQVAASSARAAQGSREAEAEANKALQLEEDAAGKTLEAARLQNAAELQAVQERNAGVQALQAQHLENQAARRQEITDQVKDYDQAVDAAKSVEEDPDRWYKNADGSTNYGKKIGAAIAVALGQFGASLAGGPNTAMSIIQDAIDKDIDAQRMAAKGRKEDVEMKRTRLDDLRQQFGDDDRAELVMQDQYLANFERQMDEVAAQSKDPQLQANYAQSKAAIQAKRADVKNQFVQQTEANIQRGLATQAQLQAQGASIGMQREELALKRDELNARRGGGDVVANLAARGLALKPGAQPSDADIKQASEVKAQSNRLSATIDRLIALRAEHGSETLPSASKKEMQTLSADLQLQYKELQKLGAISGTDKEMLDRILPADATSYGLILDQLKAAKDQIKRSVGGSLGAYGMTEMDETPSSFKAE